MQPNQDYKQLLTEVIKKQIVILGPDITLSKARNVKGLTVANDGTVTDVQGSPQEVTQALIDQFVQLSGLIVKKTMEPLLSMSGPSVQQPAAPAQPVTPPVQPQEAVAQSPIAATAQATINAATTPPTTPQPVTSPPNPVNPGIAQPMATSTPGQTPTQPAKNPLAA